MKFSAATMVALSAITPVAAFANETETTAPGFYTGSTFVPVADFAKLSKTAKKAFLAENIKDNALVLVQNGKVYDMTKEEIQNAPASEVEGLGKTVEEYTAETGKKLTPNGIVDNEAPAAELTVTSVSAINATQVEVTFNQPVDKADAETAGNTSIEGVTISNRSLSNDGKVLTLTANAPINVTNAVVVVQPIQSKADHLVKTVKYISTITYEDVVAPTIASVEAKTNGTVAKSLTVKVSEPVKTGALVKVNGAYANVDFNGTNTATITGLSLEAGKTHTLELINLEDLAGNKTVLVSADFTVSVDATVPTATLSAQSDKQILVTFNKKMDTVKTIAALANGAVKDEALAAVNSGTATVVADSNDTQFLIPVSDTLYTNKDSRTLTVVLSDGIEDALGNKLEATTQKVTLTKDTVKPVATGYNVVKDADGKVTAIEVSFSEGLAADATPAGPSIVNENGVIVTSTLLGGLTADPVQAGDKKVVYKPAAAAKISGKYAFSFAAELVSDQAETANKSATFNYTIDFGQGETVTEFELDSGNLPTASGNVITVTFDEAVKGGAVANSATDLANYTLAGKPLPTGTTITLDSAQKVATITLPAESVEKDDAAAIFTVANIKNTAGTKTVKSYTGTVDVEDNVSPVLQSAKAIDNKTIELTYSEAINLTGTDIGNDFIIKQGTDAITFAQADELLASAVSGFNKKVRITIDQGTDAAGSATAGGANSSIVSFTDQTTANADAAATTFTIADNAGTLEVKQGSDVVGELDANGDGTFTFNGVEVVITGGADTNTFTVATTAPTFVTTLDLTKDITVETKASSVVEDTAGTPNTQKAGVKVTVVKP
ncbi:hypothetical protein MHB65_03045 [Lysinibacillus sp. FSL K6-0075]|uniref:hypothetical protein n=1 Tax=Lysinibacillus sp. FSL K6-0075 TaxID=2921415 RepID=UPI0031587E91